MEDEILVKGDELEEAKEVSVIDALVEEIMSSPEKALSLSNALSKVTKPWEVMQQNQQYSVEANLTPQQTVVGSGLVTGFRLETIFGDEVAVIQKASPKWKVYINGILDSGSPMITHSKKAESQVKTYVEDKLKKLGYVTH